MNFKYFIFLLVVSFLPAVTSAQTEISFGGEITDVLRCRCPYVATHLLTIKNFDGKTIKLSYIPSISKIYMSYNYMGATYLLGTYNPGMRNMCFSGSDCDPRRDDGALGNQPGTGFSQ